MNGGKGEGMDEWMDECEEWWMDRWIWRLMNEWINRQWKIKKCGEATIKCSKQCI